ncbi:MAG: IclR family transcriptional regulator [Myxococcota bacterium]
MEATGTVDKAVDVLFHLHAQGAPQGVTAVGRALGLPKSSAHRLLAALGRRGLVERDDRGRYRPGIGLVALGLGALESDPVVAAARPVLEAAARDMGETCFLVGARAERLVVLAKAEGKGFLRASPQVGASVPVHATAVGKIFLAFGAGDVSADPHFERFSLRTVPDAVALDAEVARARHRGFAENRDEWIPGLSVLAAPVRAGERLLAAVAAAAPSSRYEVLGVDVIRRRTLAASERIAARVAGTGL